MKRITHFGVITIIFIVSSCALNSDEGSVTAEFYAEEQIVGVGQSITFTDNSTGNITAYEWQFPGGQPSTSTLQNPTVTYNTAGLYNVSLLVENKSNSNVSNKSEYIKVIGVDITIPNDTCVWRIKESYDIEWESNGSDYVDITLQKDGSFYKTIENSTSDDGYYTYDVPDDIESGSTYSVKIALNNNSEIFAVSKNFTINADYIEITTPTDNSEWSCGKSYAINWEGNEKGNVDIKLYDNGIYHSTIVNSTDNDGEYNYSVPIIADGDDYSIKISKSDNTQVFGISEEFTITGEQLLSHYSYSFLYYITRAGYYRRTYFDDADFNFTYPVSITSLSHTFVASDNWGAWENNNYSFIIYDKSNNTVLYESSILYCSEPSDSRTVTHDLNTPLTVTRDFYVAIKLANNTNSPYTKMQEVNYDQGNSYYSYNGEDWTKYNISEDGYEYFTSVTIKVNEASNATQPKKNKGSTFMELSHTKGNN